MKNHKKIKSQEYRNGKPYGKPKLVKCDGEALQECIGTGTASICFGCSKCGSIYCIKK